LFGSGARIKAFDDAAAAQAHWEACRSAQKPNIPMPDHRLDTAPDRRLNTAGSAA
jgi:hypothetical protein